MTRLYWAFLARNAEDGFADLGYVNMSGKPGVWADMAGLDDFGDETLQVAVVFEHHHLRAGNDDIAHLSFRHLHDAFHHGEGVGVQQFPLLGVA